MRNKKVVSIFDLPWSEVCNSIIGVYIRGLRSKHPHCSGCHNKTNVLWLMTNCSLLNPGGLEKAQCLNFN